MRIRFGQRSMSSCLDRWMPCTRKIASLSRPGPVGFEVVDSHVRRLPDERPQAAIVARC